MVKSQDLYFWVSQVVIGARFLRVKTQGFLPTFTGSALGRCGLSGSLAAPSVRTGRDPFGWFPAVTALSGSEPCGTCPQLWCCQWDSGTSREMPCDFEMSKDGGEYYWKFLAAMQESWLDFAFFWWFCGEKVLCLAFGRRFLELEDVILEVRIALSIHMGPAISSDWDSSSSSVYHW